MLASPEQVAAIQRQEDAALREAERLRADPQIAREVERMAGEYEEREGEREKEVEDVRRAQRADLSGRRFLTAPIVRSREAVGIKQPKFRKLTYGERRKPDDWEWDKDEENLIRKRLEKRAKIAFVPAL
jgi:hypothetical protein